MQLAVNGVLPDGCLKNLGHDPQLIMDAVAIVVLRVEDDWADQGSERQGGAHGDENSTGIHDEPPSGP